MRPEKVKNKELKEKVRGGTKHLNAALSQAETSEIEKFINKIICGDAGTVLSQLPKNSVDLIITSPPYNFGHNYANDDKEDTKKWDDYFDKLKAKQEKAIKQAEATEEAAKEATAATAATATAAPAATAKTATKLVAKTAAKPAATKAPAKGADKKPGKK